MNGLLLQLQQAAREGRVRVSDHALSRMLKRHIDLAESVSGLNGATLLEDYSERRQQERVLVMQLDSRGGIIHAVWEY